jgi:murein DD-endopeptidase MepM/ murein hydrolase activator NlpD
VIARAGSALALLALAGCVADDSRGAAPENTAVVQPIVTAKPTAAPVISGPTTFVFQGQQTQGGWIRGQAPGGTRSATLDGQPLALDAQGRFFAAFDRDAGPIATLSAQLSDGRTISSPLTISPREWQIERVNVARAPGGATEAFMALRRPELARIEAARARHSASDGWRQSFIWPVEGRISGRFGSQRIYRGEPAAYHSGLDIAPGAGVPYVAPADGVVVLAAQSPFTLEGNLLIIDHGMGLNSAFLHSSRLAVKEGEVVRQGQLLGYVGATGRATGPHLHWSIKWRDARLDPLLFLPPR